MLKGALMIRRFAKPSSLGRSCVWWMSFAASVAVCAGCSTPQVQKASDAASATGAAVARDEAVTVLLNYFGLEGRAIEEELVGCIGAGIRKGHPTMRIVSPDEFRRAAFPDLAPEAAPRNPQYLGMLLTNPLFKERLSPLNLRYLIAIGGATKVETKGGAVLAGGYGVGILVGAWVWDRKTQLVASILDLKQARPAAEMDASTEGTAWLVLIQGLPLGVPAFTETNACTALGDKVAQFLLDASRAR